MTRVEAARRPPSRLPASGTGTRAGAFGTAEWGLLAAIASLGGSSFLFIEVGLRSLEPGVIAAARLLLGAGAVTLLSGARRTVAREDLPRVALLGVISMSVPMVLFPVAQQWIDSSVAGMINGAVPLTTAAWSVLLLRRVPGRSQLAGLAIGFTGVLAVSWSALAGSRSTALGVALVMAAVVLYGLGANLAVPLQQRYGTLPVLLHSQLAAIVLVVPFGLASLPGSRWEWGPVLAMVPLGILGTGFAFALMLTLVGRVGGPRGTIAIYFVPLVAILLGAVLLGERVPPMALAGTALVLLGAGLASRAETGRGT